jgi:peptidyl-prolyl cis-trans isomerase A (cyclophilin A)
VAFFRAVENFMVQFGISGDPALNAKWGQQAIADDPQWLPRGPRRFRRGFVSFAGGGPNSRTTQLFAAYAGLGLGDAPHEVCAHDDHGDDGQEGGRGECAERTRLSGVHHPAFSALM